MNRGEAQAESTSQARSRPQVYRHGKDGKMNAALFRHIK
jgi:hypothetical protein